MKLSGEIILLCFQFENRRNCDNIAVVITNVTENELRFESCAISMHLFYSSRDMTSEEQNCIRTFDQRETNNSALFFALLPALSDISLL